MTTEIILNLDKDIIKMAQNYAKQKNVSLSFLIENYLLKIISDLSITEDIQKTAKGTIVDELSGIIHLDDNYDFKEDYTNYLIEKHK